MALLSNCPNGDVSPPCSWRRSPALKPDPAGWVPAGREHPSGCVRGFRGASLLLREQCQRGCRPESIPEHPRASQRGEVITRGCGGGGQKSPLSMEMAEGRGETKRCLAWEGAAHNGWHGDTQVSARCVRVSPGLSPGGDAWQK